jgi:DNA-binding transcriptional MerR regulator
MQYSDTLGQMQIGQLATLVGLNPKTLRYYEQIGLLPPPQRSPSGYRLYTAADQERLDFIAKAKAIGLTLEEIRDILTLKGNGQPPCAHVRRLLEEKLAVIEAQLRALADVRQELMALRTSATRTMLADARVCGIIEQHTPQYLSNSQHTQDTERRCVDFLRENLLRFGRGQPLLNVVDKRRGY